MSEQFTYDVFLSHSSKDKFVVRELAARLKQDGIRVWLDEDQIQPGDSIPAKIEEGLEQSRVLVLCMSAHGFGSDWAQLKSGTCGRGNLPFRDPLNKERRFIPLRLDDAPDRFGFVLASPSFSVNAGRLSRLSRFARTSSSPLLKGIFSL